MKDFFSAEKLSEDNKYDCNKCGKYTNATKTTTLKEAPNNLIINLKKFDKFGTKIKSGLEYPNQFLLNDYVKESSTKKKQSSKGLIYELYAVINHEGNYSHRGHYNAYVKSDNDIWYLCDDAKIKKFNGKTQLSSNKAYVLFYRLAEVSRTSKVKSRSTSNVSTEDAISDTKKQNGQKSKSVIKVNRKRSRWTKAANLSSKSQNKSQSVKKRDRKSTMVVVEAWKFNDDSDCTSCDSKRFKEIETDFFENSTEISVDI